MVTLEATDIRFAYPGGISAADGLSLRLAAGELVAVLGPNGSGKTTTMRILLGVLAADSGRITVDGTDITPAHRSAIGYMPEERGLYPKMPIIDQLVYLARFHGLTRQAAKKRGL